MTTIPALVTEPELAAWLTQTIGDPITNDYDATTQLLLDFDLAAKDGPSLNNRHQIVRPSSPPPPPQAGTLTSTDRAGRRPAPARDVPHHPQAGQLRPTVRGPADARGVSRHQCPFCRRFTRADLRQVTDHMTRCWQNPVLACCKTCVHHQDASGTPGEPDEWLESCTHPKGPEHEDYRFPVLHCPLWETKAP
jgi:hypothetical protein